MNKPMQILKDQMAEEYFVKVEKLIEDRAYWMYDESDTAGLIDSNGKCQVVVYLDEDDFEVADTF